MDEELYLSVEGPKGTALIFLVAGGHYGSPGNLLFEVRFGHERREFVQEGEAATVACEFAGVPFGVEGAQRPRMPGRGNWLREERFRA